MTNEAPNPNNDKNIVFETPITTVSEVTTSEFTNIEFEKYKMKINFLKWVLGTFAVAIMTIIINWGFKDRAVGMDEISQYDRYATELIVLNESPVKKRMLAQFFAYVTPSTKLRDGWQEYFKEVDQEYDRFILEKNVENNRLTQLQKIDIAKLSNAQKKEIQALEVKVQEKENIINAPLVVPQTSLNGYSTIKTIGPLKFIKSPSKKSDLAKQFEDEGFSYLLSKDIDNAINSFSKSENSYNGYHMVYDIAIYLNKNRNQLSSNNIENWKPVYNTILSKYNWKMPEKYKSKLEEQSK
jgi:predicted phosphatase